MALPVAEAMTKVAEEKERSYAHRAVAALPLAALQSVGDVPKGAIERSAESLALGQRPRVRDAFRLGRAKAIGRFGAGAVTTPLFLSGVQDLQSKDKKKRREGAVKVIGSGMAFSATKGGLEAAVDRGLKSKDVGKAVRAAFGTRAVTGAAGGLLTAQSIAKSLDTAGKTESEKKRDALKPYVVGGALGLGEGVVESGLEKGLRTPGARRAAMAKGLGRAAGGVAGAALLKEIARLGTKRGMEKRASPESSDAYDAYLAAYQWAGSQPPHVAAQRAMELQAEARMGSLRRATVAGISDAARKRPPRKPVRPEVADVAAMGMVVAAPHIALEAMDMLPVDQRDILLRDAVDRLAVARAVDIHLTDKGYEGARAGAMYVAPDTPAGVAAHELGHATAGKLRQATIGSAASIKAHRLAATVSSLVPLAVFLSTTERDFAEPEDVEARAAFLENLGKMMALAATPKLAEEGLASLRAAQYLRQVGAEVPGASRKVLVHTLARQIPAFATYAAPMALPFFVANQLRAKARKAQEMP